MKMSSDRKAISTTYIHTLQTVQRRFINKNTHYCSCSSLLLVKENNKQVHMFWGAHVHIQSFSLPPTAGKYRGGKERYSLARTEFLSSTFCSSTAIEFFELGGMHDSSQKG